MANSKRRGKRPAAGDKKGWGIVLKAVLLTSVLTMLCMLAMALLLKNGILSMGAVSVVNQVLKVLGIAFAAWAAVRMGAEHPWFRGLAAGLGYIVAGIVIFSVFVGSADFSLTNLLDLAMGAAVGAAVGLLLGKKTAAG